MKDIEILELEGSSLSMGREHGEHFREQINELYKIRLDSVISYAKENWNVDLGEDKFIRLGNWSYTNLLHYDVNGMDEIQGIAEGSGLTIGKIMAMQGMTDFRDQFHGILYGSESDECTTLCIDKSKTKDNKMIVAQTWDLATSNMPYVIGLKKKHISSGITSCSLTVTGCLDMAGVNSHGISTLTNNLKCRNNSIGIPYLSILSKCLMEKRISKAYKNIVGCDRAGGHYYLIADGESAYGIECTAEFSEIFKMQHGKIVHTNHYLSELSKYEYQDPSYSSYSRYDTVKTLCNGKKHSVETVKKILMDESCGENSINRKDYDGISTNGSVIIIPEDRKIYLSQGYPDDSNWKEVIL
jgi:isopenicillin-N N-acyltransferase-like protein